MKILYCILLLIFTGSKQGPVSVEKTYTLLALGDSYTIGEGVLLHENFPYQVTVWLRKTGLNFQAPEIIAKTGWTTDELLAAINHHSFLPTYDFVTLLIGVNNQYRGRSPEEYKMEFESLLKQAIRFAGNKNDRVIVLSIPDWGATPFAEGRDRQKIASEIDAYNTANKAIAEMSGVHYINITPGTREVAGNPEWLAGDGLHPSAKEYARWATMIAPIIKAKL
jgi:lysophospholipase L1-like esterase